MRILAAARILADIPPEPDAAGATGWAMVAAIVIVVLAVAGLVWARRRRRETPEDRDGSSSLLLAPGVAVLADAAPGGPVLIGFLLFVLIVLVLILVGIVLAIIGIRRWLKRRNSAQH